ncbi:MAG: hypothetical protein PWQ57_3237 [Desulfovibrionales bacterium]|nr:hypothetical protein [Desulfovibrionales bacterium]
MDGNRGRASMIFENADVRTQDHALPRAEALAVRDGRILAVGSNRDMAALAGRSTQRIDLEGRLCLPGFMDAHFHYYQWAMGRSRMHLESATSFAHAMSIVRGRAQAAARGEWLQGQGLNETDWPENQLPLRADLDAAAPDNPLIVWRCDLHLAVANSEALRLAGLADGGAAPGGVERDASGRLTGVLRESAINLVKNAAPAPSLEHLVEAMRDAQSAAHAMGLTGLHDVRMSGVEREAALTLRAWQVLRERGELALRCWTGIPGESRRLAQDLGLRTGLGDEYLRIGHLKYFFDGGMGARTGWMLAPYKDTGSCGQCMHEPEELFQEMCEAHDAGLAVMVHVIGDRASRELVGLFERLLAPDRRKTGFGPAVRHRMEHAQVIRPEDVRRLAKLGVPVSMTPANMLLDINMIEQCAPDIADCAYAFRSMMDAGVLVLFSSDCPVSDPNPLVGIQAAATRRRNDGTPEGGWRPEQRVTVDQAVQAYTAAPAAAYGRIHAAGTLRPGRRADFIALDRNIYEIDPSEISRATVALTVFDGRIVYESA